LRDHLLDSLVEDFVGNLVNPDELLNYFKNDHFHLWRSEDQQVQEGGEIPWRGELCKQIYVVLSEILRAGGSV